MRIHVVIGDYGSTASESPARSASASPDAKIIAGAKLERLDDAQLDALLAGDDEIICARTSPEAKLRICQALQARGPRRRHDR